VTKDFLFPLLNPLEGMFYYDPPLMPQALLDKGRVTETIEGITRGCYG